MLWKVTLFLITSHQMSWTMPIIKINNAIFDPNDSNQGLTSLSNIASCDSCICQCYETPMCITANYYGIYQICALFSAPLQQGQLHLVTTDQNTTVISFQNRSSVGECKRQIFIFFHFI
jgi:hypothetical protein